MGRSRSYPVQGLRWAVSLALKLLERFGNSSISPEALAVELGFSSHANVGDARRCISALKQFGVLDEAGDDLILSSLGQLLARAQGTEAERRSARCEALTNPELFGELVLKYCARGRLPRSLASELVAKHRITAKASADVEKIFLESARFAGLVDDEGYFLGGRSSPVEKPLSGSGLDPQNAERARVWQGGLGLPKDVHFAPISNTEFEVLKAGAFFGGHRYKTYALSALVSSVPALLGAMTILVGTRRPGALFLGLHDGRVAGGCQHDVHRYFYHLLLPRS